MVLRKKEASMSGVPFDTLAFAKKLEARGVENKQAEAHAEVLAEVFEETISTKQEANFIVTTLSQEIQTVKNELQHEIKTTRAELRTEIAGVKSEVIKWVFAISFAQAALIVSMLKFFH